MNAFAGRTVAEIIADPKTPARIRGLMASAVREWDRFESQRSHAAADPHCTCPDCMTDHIEREVRP